jgi:hypothetical protein
LSMAATSAVTVTYWRASTSMSWTLKGNLIVRYHDCRPAIRGDAIIVAPATKKSVPEVFRPIWDRAASALAESDTWIVIGYSFPSYDLAINELFRSNASHRPHIHVLNPDRQVADRVRPLLHPAIVHEHAGLPEALADLAEILDPHQ